MSSGRKGGKKSAGSIGGVGGGGARHREKYVDLLSEHGDQASRTVQLPGRHQCTCEARRHALVNNCTRCGRIVCAQEASGPCLFCGHLVATNEEEQIMNLKNKRSKELRARLLGHTDNGGGSLSISSVGSALGEAIKQKDKLLTYDKDSERRTRVLDDQTDYYSFEHNPYIPQAEKEALRKAREELLKLNESFRRGRGGAQKIDIDFLGRSVSAANVESSDQLSELRRRFESMLQRAAGAAAANAHMANAEHTVHVANAPVHVELVEEHDGVRPTPTAVDIVRTERLLNSVWRPESSEAAAFAQYDSAACLCVNQPFASMIVRRIKTAECRSWYTRLRGRLWIASTNKYCESDFAIEIERFYERRYDGKLPSPFPDQYQSGVLLGCVDLVDCVTQEEYDALHPEGECDSGAYVLLLENGHELHMPLPIHGSHKIFTLDSRLHANAARMIAMPAP